MDKIGIILLIGAGLVWTVIPVVSVKLIAIVIGILGYCLVKYSDEIERKINN